MLASPRSMSPPPHRLPPRSRRTLRAPRLPTKARASVQRAKVISLEPSPGAIREACASATEKTRRTNHRSPLRHQRRRPLLTKSQPSRQHVVENFIPSRRILRNSRPRRALINQSRLPAPPRRRPQPRRPFHQNVVGHGPLGPNARYVDAKDNYERDRLTIPDLCRANRSCPRAGSDLQPRLFRAIAQARPTGRQGRYATS